MKEFHPDRSIYIVYCLYIESSDETKEKENNGAERHRMHNRTLLVLHNQLLLLLFLSCTLSVSCVRFIFFMLFFVILLVKDIRQQIHPSRHQSTNAHAHTEYTNINWFILWVIVNDPFWWLWFKVILSKIAVKKQIKIVIHPHIMWLPLWLLLQFHFTSFSSFCFHFLMC